MTRRYTPGPWTNYANTEIRAPNNFIIAIISKPGLRNETTDANARLVAAAPDMLEALLMAQTRLTELSHRENSPTTLSFVNAAIEKATKS